MNEDDEEALVEVFAVLQEGRRYRVVDFQENVSGNIREASASSERCKISLCASSR